MVNPGGVPQLEITRDKFKDHRVSSSWGNWFNSILVRLLAATQIIGRVALLDQTAVVVAANLPAALPTTGLYRVSWYFRITRAATTSSAVRLTLGWVDATRAMTFQGANINGNTLDSYESGTLIVLADIDTFLTYAASYSSVGATSAGFELSITVEAL